jgi:phosphopantetheinyl transferase
MSSSLHIEPIAPESLLRESADAEDLSLVEGFASEHRRREVLAWRAVVRRELGCDVEISHDEYGAPTLNLSNIYISVSHSRDRVAVLFSDGGCAVDIESSERDFGRVATRYLSSEELQLAEQNDLYAEIWCAKEALYKYYRKGGLDFVREISIRSFDSDRGVLQASILGGEPIEVKLSREENFVIAIID